MAGYYARVANQIVVTEKLRGLFEERLPNRAEGECWEWQGAKDSKGYGILKIWVEDKRKTYLAHRISHEIYIGPIPSGLVVLHICDNPLCSNPNHLRAGTQRENVIDAVEKGRMTPSPPNRRHSDDIEKSILDLLGQGKRQAAIAREFGVSQSLVSKIKTSYMGKTRLVSDEDVLKIHHDVNNGVEPSLLAEQYGINVETVKGIKMRRNYRCLKNLE